MTVPMVILLSVSTAGLGFTAGAFLASAKCLDVSASLARLAHAARYYQRSVEGGGAVLFARDNLKLALTEADALVGVSLYGE